VLGHISTLLLTAHACPTSSEPTKSAGLAGSSAPDGRLLVDDEVCRALLPLAVLLPVARLALVLQQALHFVRMAARISAASTMLTSGQHFAAHAQKKALMHASISAALILQTF
jgi:hypothetical protein